ncbi:MAG: hypothetical protein MI919_02415 [Holophagales bacterium]|nr:hypothetical protein [Holophagales bacterium]
MDKKQADLFEIELVQDTSLEAARVVPIPINDDDGGGQSNSNCSTNNASDMP